MSVPISYRAELSRKALHLLALALPLGAWLLGRQRATLVLGLLTGFALVCDVLRARSQGFNHLIERCFGWMMRQEEKAPVPGPVRINGASWVLVSLLLTLILFPLTIALPAFVAFMVGDAVAALVGRRWGATRWPGTTRTVEGSAAFFAVAAGVLLTLRVPVPAALGCAAVSTCLEALPGPLNDNLRVPLGGALVLLLFSL